MNTGTLLGVAALGVGGFAAYQATAGESRSSETPTLPRMPTPSGGGIDGSELAAILSNIPRPSPSSTTPSAPTVIQAGGGSDGTTAALVELLQQQGENARQTVEETTEKAKDTATETTEKATGGGASGTVADRVADLVAQGPGANYDLRTAEGVPDKVRAGAEIAQETGTAVQQTRDTGTDFARQNPYVITGTVTGATLGSVVPGAGTAAGAAIGAGAGSIAELTADTVTGGTPLGVQSPVNNDSDGALWDGGDPFNLRRFTQSDD